MNAFCEKECAFSGRGLITLASCAICRADKKLFSGRDFVNRFNLHAFVSDVRKGSPIKIKPRRKTTGFDLTD